MKQTSFALLGGLLLLSSSTIADTLMVETEFRPSAANPEENMFTNITPETGYCTERPADCQKAGVFSLLTNLEVSNRHINSKNSDLRYRSYQRLNSQWRKVTLRDVFSGRNIEAEFRIIMLAHQTNTIDTPGSYYSNNPVAGGCSHTVGWGTPTYNKWAWIHPEGINICHRDITKVDPAASLTKISIGYELRAQNPMTLPNGSFKGSVSYSVGKDQDIDLGEGSYNDPQLTINIITTIQHELIVSHKGSEKVTLTPPGGWQDWITSGATQFTLKGKGEFTMGASSPISITARCTHQVLNDCAIQKEGDDGPVFVPVHLALTLPGMKNRDTGENIVNTVIPVYAPQTPGIIVQPENFLNTTGTIDFTVNEVSSLRMGQYPGSVWKGDATIIFDADLPFFTSK